MDRASFFRSASIAVVLTTALGVFVTPAAAASSAGITERISVDSAEAQGDGPSSGYPGSGVSADGRYIAFTSDATNLVADDTNNARDVFVRDRTSGATMRVSVDSSGVQANNYSNRASISSDGRFVAFETYSDNLVASDTNSSSDVFVHDRLTGITERVSLDASGNQLGGAFDADISGDGRYVTFVSDGLFVRDRLLGTTERVDVNSTEAAGNVPAGCDSPTASISQDGRFVAFCSRATNLDPRPLPGSTVHVYVRDLQMGTTELADVNDLGMPANTSSDHPSISGDGRYVSFDTESTNLGSGEVSFDRDVFVRDRTASHTQIASVDSSGNPGDNVSDHGSLSSDGSKIAFYSYATNLVAGDTNSAIDVFVHDLQNGSTERASVSSSGIEGNDASTYPVLNANGRYVVFTSDASNLVPGDTNGQTDIFLRDTEGSIPASVTVSPAAAVNPVGTNHSMTATVQDAAVSPVAGAAVLFTISGSINTTRQCVTDAIGQCSVSYTGPALPGADIIVACADSNGNGFRDSGEPCGEATKAWLLPTSTAGQVTGGGHVLHPQDGEEVAFGFNAKSTSNGLNGNCTVVDKAPVRNIQIKCQTVDVLSRTGNTATIFGQALINGVATTYRIDVTDNGEPGSTDSFVIQTASGYSAGGLLTNGNIQVRD